MSWIIKKMKNHKKAAAMLVLLSAFAGALLVLKMYVPAMLLTAAAAANELTVRKMNRQKAPFGTKSRIRNADLLVIGDISPEAAKRVAGQGTVVSIYLPGCSLAGAYEVLRHTFSILKENGGKALIVVKERNMDREYYSLFDAAFFHIVTVRRLGLDKKRRPGRFPIIFAPVKSLMFLFGAGTVKNMKDYNDEEIMQFCSNRGIEGRILAV